MMMVLCRDHDNDIHLELQPMLFSYVGFCFVATMLQFHQRETKIRFETVPIYGATYRSC